MKILRTCYEVRRYAEDALAEGKTLGLVPTMGALHGGHLTLMMRAVRENDLAVASLFVNPTQFNNPDDLARYPRNEIADFNALEKAGVSAVFAPSVKEVYPDGQDEGHVFDLGTAAEVMEGKYRPGHFQGVAQIVSKLFRLVTPTRAYFGEKDFQQIAVIRNMVKSEGIDVDIVSCPIERAEDGLALSSRNALLTAAQRMEAPQIYRELLYAQEYSRDHSVAATHDTVVEYIDSLPHCRVEYFEIVDGDTLLPVADWSDSDNIVGCITVYCGDVRLIDNIRFRPLPQA